MKMQLVLLGALCCQVMGAFASDDSESWTIHEVGGKIYRVRRSVPFVGIAEGRGTLNLEVNVVDEKLAFREISDELMAPIIERGDAEFAGYALPEEEAKDAEVASTSRVVSDSEEIFDIKNYVLGDGQIVFRIEGKRNKELERALADRLGVPFKDYYESNAEAVRPLIDRYGAETPIRICGTNIRLRNLAEGNSFGDPDFTVAKDGKVHHFRICEDGAIRFLPKKDSL